MNPRRTLAGFAVMATLALASSAVLLAGCDVDSVDSTTSVPSDNSGTIYNFSGLYMNPQNSTNEAVLPLVYPLEKQSGVALTWLRLLQYGSVLEAYDNAGMNWSGSITALQTGTATFGLTGKTTAGQAVQVTGTLVYEDQKSTMDAAWIEPSFAGTIIARATVSPATTNTSGGNITVTADDRTVNLSQVVRLNASGCSGTYTWEQSNAFGTLSPSGSTATYTRTAGASGLIVTITVNCSSGGSGSTTLQFN